MMKAVKMRVPKGMVKEAHKYMRLLGYEYPNKNDKGRIFGYTGFIYGSKKGVMSRGHWSKSDDFENNKSDEVFLCLPDSMNDITVVAEPASHAPKEKSIIDMDKFTEGRLRKDCQDMSFKPSLWHLHFLFDLLDKERNK